MVSRAITFTKYIYHVAPQTNVTLPQHLQPQTWVTGKGAQTHFHLGDLPPDVIVRDSSGHEWRLHKCILTHHSKVFAVRFDPNRPGGAAWNSFESSSDPTSGAPIITLPNELPDFSHGELSRLFHFMYTGHYSIGNPRQFLELENQLLAHSRCFALGHRFDVPGLKELAVQKFRVVAAKEKEDHYDPSQHLDRWARVTDSVFSLTAESDLEMRSAVIDRLGTFNAKDIADNDQMQDMIERHHDLATHMYRLMSDKFEDKTNEEMRYKTYFYAKGATTTEEEDKIMAEASEGW